MIYQVQRGRQCEEGVMKDYCDGDQFKSHSLFSVQANSLQLFLYYDDVEVCNSLGSSKTEHKIGKYMYVFYPTHLYRHSFTTYYCLLYTTQMCTVCVLHAYIRVHVYVNRTMSSGMLTLVYYTCGCNSNDKSLQLKPW